MGLTSARGQPGATVYLCLQVTSPLPLTGLQASISVPDDLAVEPTGIAGCPPACIDDLASLIVEQAPGCLALGVVVDFSAADCTYPPGDEHAVAILPVVISPDAQPGDSLRLPFVDGCGMPAKRNLLALRAETGGLEKCYPEPDNLHEGVIEVVMHQEAPGALNCELEGESVRLTWENRGVYDRIDVFRDEELLETLPGEAASYTDSEFPPGVHSFEIKAYADCLGYGRIGSASCSEVMRPLCCPETLVCEPDPSGVLLTWANCEAYDSLEIWRDGEPLETLPGDYESYADLDAPAGRHVYGLVATRDSASCHLVLSAGVCVAAACPQNLRAAIVSCNAVRLEWDNLDSYELVVVEKNGETIAALERQENYYEDTDAAFTASTKHHYRIVAWTCDGMATCWGDQPLELTVAPRFRRGDVNADGSLDISDAVSVLGFLFLGASPPSCIDAADVNDDATIDISDGVSILLHLFLGGIEPPVPFRDCGVDPTEDDLNCECYPPCWGVTEPALAGGGGQADHG